MRKTLKALGTWFLDLLEAISQHPASHVPVYGAWGEPLYWIPLDVAHRQEHG